MADPWDVFMRGVRGEILTPGERMFYYAIWKTVFSIVAALASLAIDVFIFHKPYGDTSLWLLFLFWVVFMILETIKKYDTVYHKNSIIVDALIAQAVTFFREHGMPLPPDMSEQTSVPTSRLQPLPTPEQIKQHEEGQ